MRPDLDDQHEANPTSRRRQYRLSTLMVSVAGLALGLGLLRMPGVGGLIAAALAGVGVTLAILLGAMALGWLGFGLFALFDRLVTWSCREPEWFQPTVETHGWASEEHREP